MFSRKIITIAMFFIVLISLSAQHKHKGRGRAEGLIPQPVSIETHVVPSDTIFTCYILFKVAFRNLVFVKGSRNFIAGVSLAIEIEKDDERVDRVIKKSKVLTDDYELTKSPNLYLNDIISIDLPKGDYIFYPAVSIKNTDIDVKLKPLNVSIDDSILSRPITVNKQKIIFNNNEVYSLVNNRNSIPYSVEEYDLLIPVFDQSVKSIDVEILQERKTIIRKNISEFESMNLNFTSYNDQIIINDDIENPEVKLFKINYVNQNLNEGIARIKIKLNERTEEFMLPILWSARPRSLRDPEVAIKMLKLIGKNQDAEDLLDEPDEEYYNVLYDYWKQYDNDTTTAFNEVFAEFYSRVDYANKNFKSLRRELGSESDRGIVYLKFGKPDSIDREYNETNNVIEIWYYKAIDKKIYFSDKTGTGDFIKIK